MNVEALRKKIDSVFYEARILDVSCNYFADEVSIVYEEGVKDEGNIQYHFLGCVKVEFNFWPTYPKEIPYRDALDCNLHNFELEVIHVNVKREEDGKRTFYQCQLDMFPLSAKIWCKEIHINRILSDGSVVEI